MIIRDIPDSLPLPCVATIGFFDGVHAGHRFLIGQVKEAAAAMGLASAVITFPVHPRKVMNADYMPELLTSCDEKLALLSDTGIDYCFVLNFTPELSRLTAGEFMRDILGQRYNVRGLVIGYDHRFGRDRSEGFEDYRRIGNELGIDIVRARACSINNKTVSSSVIRRFLHEGEVGEAARCLSYSYFMDGIVVGGYKVGRTIGYPTANLRVNDPEKLVPAGGVYAVWVEINGDIYAGMLNIGHRPTIGNGKEQSIEVHILNFDGDIYNCPIRLYFAAYIRAEIKFSSKEELALQLAKDAGAVRQELNGKNPLVGRGENT